MPLIKPFCALKADAALLSHVVTRPIENYAQEEAKQMVAENDISFLHLTNPELSNPNLTVCKPELLYKTISDNLDSFLDNKVLITEEKAAIYIYQLIDGGVVQTGIWTLTHISDYLNGNIKRHELTLPSREKLLADYLQETGLDANPVLITYPPNVTIKSVIAKYLEDKPIIDFTYADHTQHKVWAIDQDEDLEILVSAFAEIGTVYIADGHHRLASMAKMSSNRKKEGDDKKLSSDFFTTVYMDNEQLQILEYNRVINDLAGLTDQAFLEKIKADFDIRETEKMERPKQLHQFALYLKSGWYSLTAKKHTYHNNPVSVLDVKILQDFILVPVLNIQDPRTDPRIRFEGGKACVKAMQERVDQELDAAVFILNPISINQLIDVADAGEVMPPKSTWVEPKFLVGLLTHRFGK
ncbi:DUF1015 domain-containing protein [Pedobacter sp. GSP4]|uniref:DUF1015 domain-containing protein n=1 Tax=Pedobacter sp. GSP4 TaxID=3453716 RepID=UPI003EEDBC56